MTVQDVYNAIDTFAPFSTQEKWDNSGLLVNSGLPVKKVLVTLDISVRAVDEALEKHCDLIVSHHPVIFSPIKSLMADSPVYKLANFDISAICCHTPLDIAPGGINDLLVERLRSELDFSEEIQQLEASGLGRIVTFAEPMQVSEIAEAAKKALGCPLVRYSITEFTKQGLVKRLGICSGSGASLLEELTDGITHRCTCLMTGDVKHDRWYKAQELGINLIDCGHYHTEILMVPYVAQKLQEALPELEVIKFIEGDPVQYL